MKEAVVPKMKNVYYTALSDGKLLVTDEYQNKLYTQALILTPIYYCAKNPEIVGLAGPDDQSLSRLRKRREFIKKNSRLYTASIAAVLVHKKKPALTLPRFKSRAEVEVLRRKDRGK